jgi:hypothetical protein
MAEEGEDEENKHLAYAHNRTRKSRRRNRVLRRAIATTPQRSPAVIYTLERIRVPTTACDRELYQRISKISNFAS